MTEPSLMEDPCAMDSWAALHLPSIELLLSASSLEDLYKRPARDLHSGYWTLEQPKEVGSGTDLPGAQWLCFARLAVAALRSKKPVLKAEAEGTDGGAEGRMNGRIGHKKVLKRINIQEMPKTGRNVPNQLNRKQFVERLDQLGFHGMYDFVYVPIDRATRMNVGYAFVNFVNPDSFRLCQSKLQGKKFLEKDGIGTMQCMCHSTCASTCAIR
eukprot:g2298.t1